MFPWLDYFWGVLIRAYREFEERVGKIKTGMLADVVPEIPGKTRYVGKVKIVDRVINAASGTFVVFLEMPNAKHDVPTGAKCRAEFGGIEDAAAAKK